MKVRIATFIVAVLIATSAFAAAGGGTTAQSIMVYFNNDASYTMVNNKTYKFNAATAATYYTNAWDGNAPSVKCQGPGCGTAPTAPGAPAPDARQLTGNGTAGNPGWVGKQKCVFASGGVLPATSYTQTAQISLGSGRTGATYTYTYTYVIAPTVASVAPLTAWDLFSTSGNGIVSIPITGFIAGESVTTNSNPKIGTKYSFSIRNSDGTSRIANVVVTLTDLNNNGAVLQTFAPNANIIQNTPGSAASFTKQWGDIFCTAGLNCDFFYVGNAGTNGNTALLATNLDARSLLNGDTFAGNNDGGSDGSALAGAALDTITLTLPSGDYGITLTGTVKDNSANTSVSFSVNNIIHINATGCGQQQ